ncbi:hypothetical protein ACNS7O_14275 [Haloferacaceae archaeon DSL9]
MRLWDNLDDEEFVERFARKGVWATGGPDMTGALYRQFVDELLVQNRLLKNEWSLCGRRVDLDALDAPVLLIVGRDDAFIPRAAGEPFLRAVGSDDASLLEFPTGHVGLSVAPEAHATWWPKVCDWLEARS